MIAITHAVSPLITECELTFINREPIDYQLACQQHDNYCQALRSLGAQVITLSDNLDYADCCFVEDTAIIVDEVAVITSMGVASRRKETPAIEKVLAQYRDIAHIDLPATIEGGDLLKAGKTLYLGVSNRTNMAGVNALADILAPFGYQVKPVTVKGSLHLKTACTLINDNYLLANPAWVDINQFADLNIIYTPDAEPWAANVLKVGDQILAQAGFPQTLELITALVSATITVDISEFRKAEAGLTCLSLLLNN
jgi:dimethylargininase